MQMLRTLPDVATLPQSQDELTDKQRAYIERCDERAMAADLAVMHARLANGRYAVYVASQTRADTWHLVTRVGNRYLCFCEAMYSPAYIDDTGEYHPGTFNRFVTCIHCATVKLRRQGKLPHKH